MRTLPDFLVIGAQRCGTSSLYKYLGRHPQVVPSIRKEVDFFSTRYYEGEGWYRAHFPLAIRGDAAKLFGRSALQTFEATPDYLLHPGAAGRAAALIPEARIIVLVRDPVERAYSHYQHNRSLGQEPLEFEAALDVEPHRLANEVDRLLEDPSYQARSLRRFSYVTRGLYAEQLVRWLATFGREQMLVLGSRDLFANTAETFDSLLGFLGLERWQPPVFHNYSQVRAPESSYEPLSDRLRQRLATQFLRPNQNFYELVGHDFSWQQ